MTPLPRMQPVEGWLTSIAAWWVLGQRGGAVALMWQMSSGTWTAVRFADGSRLWGERGTTRSGMAELVFSRRLRVVPVLTVFAARRRFRRLARHGGLVFLAGCESAARYGLVDGSDQFKVFVVNFYRACQLLPA